MNTDDLFINRCFQLAKLGKNSVHPNPLVGCVIVNNGSIIGEGYHQKFGGPHAEVIAIHSVINKKLLASSTLYVNLEPCCHWGKTPPCTQLIIESGIQRVVICNTDPNPLVAGKGIIELQKADITVISGILNNIGYELNKDFYKLFKPKKSVKYIIKWAETADGYMGKKSYISLAERELSNGVVNRWIHKLRSEVDAILIGTNTALIDNPILDNRFWYGPKPIIILIDRSLQISQSHKIFTNGSHCIVFNEIKNLNTPTINFFKINFQSEKNGWTAINQKLIKIGIHKVLIEGGASTIQKFLESKLKYEAIIIKTPKIWGSEIKAPEIKDEPYSRFNLSNNQVELYGE